MKRLRWILLILPIIAIAGIWFAAPHHPPVGSVFREPGRYASPNGTGSVEISRGANGQVNYVVNWTTPRGSASTAPDASFRSDSGWVMTWDQQDRLWAYFPESGVVTYYSTEEGDGSMTVGPNGGDEGMPSTFAADLPEHLRSRFRIATNR